jgi:hypothetical protein
MGLSACKPLRMDNLEWMVTARGVRVSKSKKVPWTSNRMSSRRVTFVDAERDDRHETKVYSTFDMSFVALAATEAKAKDLVKAHLQSYVPRLTLPRTVKYSAFFYPNEAMLHSKPIR